MTKKIGGRPQKYDGEEPVRLTVSIRPRYKKIIEDLTAYRSATMSEVVELAIAQLAISTELEAGSSYNGELVSLFEMHVSIKGLLASIYRTSWIVSDENAIKASKDKFDAYFNAASTKPKSLMKPIDIYVMDVVSLLLGISITPIEITKQVIEQGFDSVNVDDVSYGKQNKHLNFSLFLNFDSVIEIIHEQWRIGRKDTSIVADIMSVLYLIQEKEVQPYSDDIEQNIIELQKLFANIRKHGGLKW